MFRLDMVLIWLTGDFASNEWLVAVPTGLEPVTFGLGNRCSIRLSYGTRLRNFL
jgi:hypothetical protein